MEAVVAYGGNSDCSSAQRIFATALARIAVALLPVALLVFPPAWLVHHVYLNRAGVPDLESFMRFEPPTTGVVRDVHGKVLIELAREYRRVVTYDEVPLILRQAILAAEDKSFFTRSAWITLSPRSSTSSTN